MSQILQISCSPFGRLSQSYRLSSKIVQFLVQKEPTATVAHRVLDGTPFCSLDADYALSQVLPRDVSSGGSFARSDELIRELENSSAVVIGTPMHNFTVPAPLKLWIDHVVRVRRTFDISPNGKIPLLPDRPVYVAISSGGRFSGEFARQPDFLRPYLTAILGMIGLQSVTFFSIEGAGSSPAAKADALARVDDELRQHFSSFADSPGSKRHLVAAQLAQ